MPTTWRPSTGTRASVTIPAGFVKFSSQASGQWRRIWVARSSMRGMDRNA